MRQRFDYHLLDPEQPSEIDDGNEPHLFKHLPVHGADFVRVGPEDLYDLYVTDAPVFFPARPDGPADWLIVGQVPAL